MTKMFGYAWNNSTGRWEGVAIDMQADVAKYLLDRVGQEAVRLLSLMAREAPPSPTFAEQADAAAEEAAALRSRAERLDKLAAALRALPAVDEKGA